MSAWLIGPAKLEVRCAPEHEVALSQPNSAQANAQPTGQPHHSRSPAAPAAAPTPMATRIAHAASVLARGMALRASGPLRSRSARPVLQAAQARRAATAKAGAGKTVFLCTDCGNETAKWQGQCPSCKGWNTLKEFKPQPSLASPAGMGARLSQPKSASRGWDVTGSGFTGGGGAGGGRLVPITAYANSAGLAAGAAPGGEHGRVSTGASEVDRVLGGGLVRGSVVLLAGSPGIGKSTLVLQLARSIAKAPGARGRVAYIAGEESPAQIARRAVRLVEAEAEQEDPDLAGGLAGIEVLNETSLDGALQVLLDEAIRPAVERSAAPDGAGPPSASPAGSDASIDLPFDAVIVDSIQTMYLDGVASAAGTVSQVRECALRLLQLAKASSVPVVLVGHMTKAGEVAGPRVLEHLVDAVVLLEGEGAGTAPVRVLRSAKNRFGATSEVALLVMSDAGLVEVEDPAGMFLSPARAEALRCLRHTDAHDAEDAASALVPAGSAVTATLEGRRALCVEIEALCNSSAAEWPRHRASGVSVDRVHMLLAVLAKHAGVRVGRSDVYLSVAGGIRLRDPAAEAAVAASLASSALDIAMPADTAILGEVALSGELRAVAGEDERLRALAALGFRRVILPLDSSGDAASAPGSRVGGARAGKKPRKWMQRPDGGRLTIVRVRDIREALASALGRNAIRDARAAHRRTKAARTAAARKTDSDLEGASMWETGGWLDGIGDASGGGE